MDDWVTAVISAASGLAGAAIGGAATYLTQRQDRRDRGRGELSAALSAFGYAIDDVHRELQRLPRDTRVSRSTEALVNRRRTPALNYLVEWAHAKTIGRDAYRALDRFQVAANRLLLVAPRDLLPVMEEVTTLFAEADAHDDAWEQRWRAARNGLGTASRAALHD